MTIIKEITKQQACNMLSIKYNETYSNQELEKMINNKFETSDIFDVVYWWVV